MLPGVGADNQGRISEIYELMTSRDYSILGVGQDNKIGQLNSVDDFVEGNDPNYMFVPNELVGKFLDCVDELKSCDVKSRAA